MDIERKYHKKQTRKYNQFNLQTNRELTNNERRRWTFHILRALNRMGVKSGRITSPSSLLRTVFLLFNGDTNLFANLEGENDLRSFAAVDDEGFKAFFLLRLVDLVGERERESGGGDLVLTKNLCGDFVLQNLWWFLGGDEWNNGFGNSTVFLAQGRFLGDTLFAE